MGFFKKIFKPFKKVFKKIGKFVKKQFKRVGKWMGKLGVFGQVALMFIPGLGPMISGLFKGLGQGALRLLGVGLKSANPLIKGASWLLDTARKVAGGVYKGFKTVTSAATSFIKNSTKYLANKIPGLQGKIAGAPETFFGGGGDSVLGKVGAEVSNNFGAFKDTVLGTEQVGGGRAGGLFSGAESRNIAVQDQLNITEIAGVKVDKRKLIDKTLDPETQWDSPATEAAYKEQFAIDNEELLDSIGEGILDQKGQNAFDNFNSFKQTWTDKFTAAGIANPAAQINSFIAAEPGYMNKLINSSYKTMGKWTDSFTGGVDPFDSFRVGDKGIGEKIKGMFGLPSPKEFVGKAITSTGLDYLKSSLLAPDAPGPRYGFDPFANYRTVPVGYYQQSGASQEIPDFMAADGMNGGYYGLGYVAQPMEPLYT